MQLSWYHLYSLSRAFPVLLQLPPFYHNPPFVISTWVNSLLGCSFESFRPCVKSPDVFLAQANLDVENNMRMMPLGHTGGDHDPIGDLLESLARYLHHGRGYHRGRRGL
jgi:hypothetical protein